MDSVFISQTKLIDRKAHLFVPAARILERVISDSEPTPQMVPYE
jgi:hypothetical protein